MKYAKIRPITKQVDEIIDIWFEINKYVTQEGVEALKDTIRKTIVNYYKDRG